MASDSPSPLQGLAVRAIPLLIGAVVIGVMALRGCQKGPFDRPQVVGMSPAQEKALGAQAYNEILQKSDVLPNGNPLVTAVRRVAYNLVEHGANQEAFLKATKLRRADYNWGVQVVRSREVNAFCLPGGKMVVYTGIIPVAQTEVGLAVVLGHEIGHALAHHGAERMAQERMTQIGQIAAGASLSGLDPEQQRQIMGVINAGARFGVLLPYSRKHESEADKLGLYMMAVAGYDPREAPRFWERMQRSGGGRNPEFLSTHPSPEHRMRDLQGWASEAMPFYEQSQRANGSRPLRRR